LGGLEVFSELSSETVEALARAARRNSYPLGVPVVRQGDLADRMGVVVSGEAEVSVRRRDGEEVPLAKLVPGDVYGVNGLFGEGKRTATITALTDLDVVELGKEKVLGLLSREADLRVVLESMASSWARSNLLAAANPFGNLDGTQAHLLAERMEPSTFAAGSDLVRQGELGSSCFVLESGMAAVLREVDGSEREVDRIGPGEVFGEAALLSDQPRSATVRALEECRVLEITRADLREVMGPNAGEAQLTKLMRMRERPLRRPGVTVHKRREAGDARVITLKDRERRAYHRLSDLGLFVWDRLDGNHNLREIALDYYQKTGAMAPFAIADTIAGLARAGFAERTLVASEASDAPRSAWSSITRAARSILVVQLAIRGADRFWSAIYLWFGRWAFTAAGKIAMALIAISGFVVFVIVTPRASEILTQPLRGWLLLALPVAYTVSIFAHEAGHALSAKHYGREVDRMGIGWYWYAPIFFIDTSDMWLANRRQRIWTSVAGTYADAVIAGLAAFIALAADSPLLISISWQFALTSYLAVAFNLNPLLELDGYYVLSDLLDEPNLRRKALTWLGRSFPGVLRRPAELRKHRLELFYGLAAVAYIPFAALLSLFVYRHVIERLINRWAPAGTADVLAWVVVVSGVLLSLLAITGELKYDSHSD
jgi:putative peptide zinc metalloprotease protein